VLSRPLYRFGVFELKNVSKAQRSQALSIQIRQWSAYPNTGQYVVWMDEKALVWAWDADKLEAHLNEQKLKLAQTRVIPETLLHMPIVSGLRLANCMDGVEGQLWQDQYIIHSRWWPQAPTAEEWLAFQRDAGKTPDQEQRVLGGKDMVLLKTPWAKSFDLERGLGSTLPFEDRLVKGTVLLLAIFTVWQGIELVKTRQEIGKIKAESVLAEQSARPILEARGKSLDALARIESLQTINRYPAQLEMLARVANQLGKDGAYLNEWDFQNGKLKITIASANSLSSSFLVKKMEEVGWFRNIQAASSSDPNVLSLTMDAMPQDEIESTNTASVKANMTPGSANSVDTANFGAKP